MILVLVNECVACLREQLVEDADLVDAAVIFGTGFRTVSRRSPCLRARRWRDDDHTAAERACRAIRFSFSA